MSLLCHGGYWKPPKVWPAFSPGSLLKVSNTSSFFSKQGAEKAEESGENEAQKEDSENTGELSESQEKKVSACSVHGSLSAPSPLLSSRRVPGIVSSAGTTLRKKVDAESLAVWKQRFIPALVLWSRHERERTLDQAWWRTVSAGLSDHHVSVDTLYSCSCQTRLLIPWSSMMTNPTYSFP